MSSPSQVRQQLERLRSGQGEQPNLTGFLDAAEIPRADQGDELGRYVQVPPFPQEWQRLVDRTDRATLVTSAIDVTKWRVLTTFVQYTPEVLNARLVIRPEASLRPSAAAEFSAIAVVNPTPTVITSLSFPNGLVSRDIAPAVFRTLAAAAPGFPIAFVVQWDVSMYASYRFDFSQEVALEGQSTLLVDYTLSQ